MQKFYTIQEVSEMLRVSKKTIYRFILGDKKMDIKKKLKASKIGGQWRIKEEDLNKLIK